MCTADPASKSSVAAPIRRPSEPPSSVETKSDVKIVEPTVNSELPELPTCAYCAWVTIAIEGIASDDLALATAPARISAKALARIELAYFIVAAFLSDIPVPHRTVARTIWARLL